MRHFLHVVEGVAINRAVFDENGLPEGWPDATNWHESEAAQIGWTFDGEVFAPPVTPLPTKGELAAYAADRRWRFETGGAAWGEKVVATDRDSQSKLIAEFVAISAGLRADPSPWKFADGAFVSLTNEQMATVIMAARNHIANAFAIEAALLADIEAEDVTSFDEIDAAFAP